MNNQFDELTKSLAQTVTRRAALKQFSVGLAGMALACFGLAPKSHADPQHFCQNAKDCAPLGPSYVCCETFLGIKGCVADKSQCIHGKIIWV